MITNLYKLRMAKNLTQYDLAEISGVSRALIQRLEIRSDRVVERATLPTLMALAKALGVPIYRLLDDRQMAIDLQRIESGGVHLL